VKIKPAFFFLGLGIAIIVLTYFSIFSLTPKVEIYNPQDVLAFRKIKDKSLSSRVGAPFYQDAGFDALLYFPPNEKERFLLEVNWLENPEEADLMPDRIGYASHKKVGFVVLEKETWRDSLFLFKNLEEQDDSLYFVPFSDPSNGKKTYGGGRYLDLIVKKGKKATLDFNFAYNPWCAYKEAFVCARIPAENHLSRAIEAGEKNYSSQSHE
jgi:uncharacterized protein (DUF1684 family)